jgi:hypothetical protein
MDTRDPRPSLERVFEIFTGFQRTGALKAAIDLDLFTHVGGGADTVPALAARVHASERGVRILCDYLVTTRMLAKSDGRYTLTPDAATFFDRRSPAYVGSAIDFGASPFITQAFAEVAAAVRKGGTVIAAEGALAPEHPMWVQFARAMAPLAGCPRRGAQTTSPRPVVASALGVARVPPGDESATHGGVLASPPPSAASVHRPGAVPSPLYSEDACGKDADCVPRRTCHPWLCVAASRAGELPPGTVCTAGCLEGTLDCGYNHCACLASPDGSGRRCAVMPGPP